MTPGCALDGQLTMGEDEAQAQPVPEYEFDQRIACQVPMRKGPD